ncbi:hypothetical protein TNCV_4709761 [Trichonephila clavipes]|nr:hypothetical protein TNCV_4709761 [Trichonephila clavipes]
MEAKSNLWGMLGGKAGTCQRCLVKFRFGHFPLEDEPSLGRPSAFNDEVLCSMIRTNSLSTSPEVGFKFGIHQTTALNYIKRHDFVFKHSVWVPHELSEKKNLKGVRHFHRSPC